MRKKCWGSFLTGMMIGAFLFVSPVWALDAEGDVAVAPVDGKLAFGIETGAPGSTLPAKGTTKQAGVIRKLELRESGDTGGEFSEEFKEEEEEYVEETPDPYENFNRAMFRFNDFVYDNIFNPVARVYRDIIDEDERGIIQNLFKNAQMPIRLLSSLIQGDGHKMARVLERFFVNTAFSGGMVDVAKTEFGMEPVEEDMDQALGVRHFKTGPYFVWPLVGPSTARATIGGLIEGGLYPSAYFSPIAVSFGLGTEKKLNEQAINVDIKKEIDEMAIDSYLSVKDLYLQHRKGKLAE